MKTIAVLTGLVIIAAAASTGFAADRHQHGGHHHQSHHRHHFGVHLHRSHGLHYGLHSSSYGHHRYSSGFRLGLLFGSPRSYYYSNPYSYSYPTYRTYQYASPSCVRVIDSTPSRIEYVPDGSDSETQRQRKVEPPPPPQQVAPPEPTFDNAAPQVRAAGNIRFARLRTTPDRTTNHSQRALEQAGSSAIDVYAVSELGPQLSIPASSSLVSDDTVPFVVGDDASVPKPAVPPPAIAQPSPLVPPAPEPVAPAVADRRTQVQSIPQAMRGIALLPVDDQQAALAQRTCPVTGDLLGADGKPQKLQVAGRTVFVCCDGCVIDLKRNPDRYLTKR